MNLVSLAILEYVWNNEEARYIEWQEEEENTFIFLCFYPKLRLSNKVILISIKLHNYQEYIHLKDQVKIFDKNLKKSDRYALGSLNAAAVLNACFRTKFLRQ